MAPHHYTRLIGLSCVDLTPSTDRQVETLAETFNRISSALRQNATSLPTIVIGLAKRYDGVL